jgi:hypothetical protein
MMTTPLNLSKSIRVLQVILCLVAFLQVSGQGAPVYAQLFKKKKHHHYVPQYRPQELSGMARNSIKDALAEQVGNGQLQEYTIWNNCFTEETAELQGNGRSLLERLARKYPGQSVSIYIQTAHDISFDSTLLDEYVESRRKLDLERAKAVNEYCNVVLGMNQISLFVHDPQQNRMWAYEAAPAYNHIKRSASGVLNPSVDSGVTTANPVAETGLDPYMVSPDDTIGQGASIDSGMDAGTGFDPGSTDTSTSSEMSSDSDIPMQ